MKRYKEYKDSGVKWIGEIPGHWECRKLKTLLATPLQYGANASGVPYSEKLPRYIRITDITIDGKLKETDKLSLPKEEANKYILKNNDVLFARSGATVGKAFIFKEHYGQSAFAGYLIKADLNKEYLPKLLFHYTQSDIYESWKNGIFIQSTIQNIGADKYSQLAIPVPPLSEQQAIVSYLDSKVSKIDEYISAAEKKIAALEELKQSLIAEAVTRGINPNVPMKEPGIKWVGRVPEHWEVKRIAMLFSENKKKNSDYEFDHALKFNYGRLVPKNEIGDVSSLKDTYIGYTIINKNDLAINCLNLNYDFISQRIAIAPQKGIITSAYLIVTPRKGVEATYYNYLFKAMDSKKLC